MAIITPILALLSRMAGKLLNTIFGWATVTLFGRVTQNRQIYLSIIALGLVLWFTVVLGIAFPTVGSLLLSFVPLPEWVDRFWVRIAMLVAAVLIPPVVGAISLLMVEAKERPRSATGKARELLKGYPYTLGLALTLVLMTIFVPILKLRLLLKRWSSEHMPVLVEADDYEGVVDQIQRTLEEQNWSMQRQRASWMLRIPTRLLTWFASGSVDDLVAKNLAVLRSQSLEVLLHPADLVVNGREKDVVHARAAVAEQLSFSRAHLTWTKEGNELEDRMNGLWCRMKENKDTTYIARIANKLQDIDSELRRLEVPFKEWEVLFRTNLMLERELLRNIANVGEGQYPLTDGRVKQPSTRSIGDFTEKKTGKGGIIAVIAGASMGTLAGLFLASKPGKESRRRSLQKQASMQKPQLSAYAAGLHNGAERSDQQYTKLSFFEGW
jgi:hypothetical protein